MTHCTVCGAAAREGAKFCTSCGARLVDTVTAAPAADETATVPAVDPTADTSGTDMPTEPGADEPVHEAAWASTVTGSATGEVESVAAEPDEPAKQEASVDKPAASPEYTASWPPADDEPAATESDEATVEAEVPAQPESAWSSWSNATDEAEPREAAASFATDAVQDPEPSRAGDTGAADDSTAASRERRPSPFATDADQDARSREDRPAETGSAGEVASAPVDAPDLDDDHHGASQWESWAPAASGESTVPAPSSDVGVSVRRLLDDLANRIDRLIDPAPVAARGVDADELADQLGRWSSASTDADGLLEVVRAVRRSPRDVDALTRLADRAPDLELLVRHYQAITSGAGDWSRKLRDQRRGSTAEDA